MNGRILLPLLVLAGAVACAPVDSTPIETVDCGPRPTIEEAHHYAGIAAEQYLWGKARTEITQLYVEEKTRWYSALTNHWPRGGATKSTIEGWRITFTSAATHLKLTPRNVEILVDKDKIVYWRTHTQYQQDSGRSTHKKISY